MWGISYWVFPVISSLCWLGTLLGLLVHWVTKGKPHYPSMEASQSIAYISDTGAFELKPLFIAGASVTTIFLDLSFASERWLRHRGRLARNETITEKVMSGLSMVAAVIGTVGLICLSIFDTYRHPRMHDAFLFLFIGGYVLSAIFICWEYQRLGINFRQHRVLRISFWIKLAFILVEIALAAAFIVTNFGDHWNPAAVLEWAVAFIFTFYVASFVIDLIPAVHTKHSAAGHAHSMGGSGQDQGWHDDTAMEQEANDPVSRNHATTHEHQPTHAYVSGNGYGRSGAGQYGSGGYQEGRMTAESQRTLGRNDVRTTNGYK